VTQTSTGSGNADQAGNNLSVFWIASYTGQLRDTVQFSWYWQSPNAAAIPLGGAAATISVYADPNLSAKTGRLIGRKAISLNVGPTPTLNVNTMSVDTGTAVPPGPIASKLLIQVSSSTDTGAALTARYDSVDAPSGFVIPGPPIPAGPPVSFAAPTDQPVTFGPAAIVSPTFYGSEPQTTIERPTAASLPGALDRNRIFVDFPADTYTQSGQLYRSMDGGDTFRQLVDKTCFQRSRPNCGTAGGGDTEEEVNPVTGAVFFADQEVVAQEALAMSTDHGDTFPIDHQVAATAPMTGVDRQWLAPLAPGILSVAGQQIHAFYTYHVPLVGEYVVGITSAGLPIPQPAPQIPSVEQSGQVRVDNTTGPGRGWIYQPYRQGGKYQVATARAADYATPAGWQVNTVASSNPTIFPWLSLDSHGNAYAVWVAGSSINYSFSEIDDAANNPTLGGRPGTKWSTAVAVDPPNIGSVVFPEVIAGDPGHVAIAYDGTESYSGAPDTAPNTARWNTYVSVLDNALAKNAQPIVVRTGLVSHRDVHIGTICTSGTTCTGDRSLLDMIDLGVDADGRVGVVFTDNNSTLQYISATAHDYPFTHFAKQVSGPSLVEGAPPIAVAITPGGRSDATGDATWPNAATGTELQSLDVKGASVLLEGTDIVARVPLVDASATRMNADLATYAASGYNTGADRLQYVVRFSTGGLPLAGGVTGNHFHMSMEHAATGNRFFGGRLDDNDTLLAPSGEAGFPEGAVYHSDAAYAVTGAIEGNTLVMRAPAAAFGLSNGQRLFSGTAFAMAGPHESATTGDLGDREFTNPMRVVDASPPFDATLGADVDPGFGIPEVPFGPLLPLLAAVMLGVAVAWQRRSSRSTAV
jgi:hypothetical protein